MKLCCMNWLRLMRYWVGVGSLPPMLVKISPKTGTTLTSRKTVMPRATTDTTVGYIMADLTFLRRRAVAS